MLCRKCNADLPENALFCCFCGCKQTAQAQHKKSRGNGQGSVYKVNGKWIAKVTVGKDRNGNYIRRQKQGFATKKEALDYIPILRGQREITKTDKRLSALWITYQNGKFKKLSANKQVHYKKAFERLSVLQNQDIDVLRIGDLQYIVDTETSTYYPAKDMKDLLSHFYELAIAERIVQTNLSKYIELPPKNEKDTIPLNADEIKRLWEDYSNGHLETGYFLLMVYTGMMPGEVMKVKVLMIDLPSKRIVGAGLKTDKRKETPIILPDIILDVVAALIEGKNPDDKIFDKWNNLFYDYWKEIKMRANLREELRPYSCRHTTASTLADANISAPIIKEIMRHAKITTTQRYIHLDQSSEQNAMNNVFNGENIKK